VEYIFSIILIAFSAMFSGLTLGYFSLNLNSLERRAKLGNKEAIAVYPIRKRGNLLLTTLLLGNVAVNTALSIYMGSLFSGVVAGFTATALIFVFGEILPQAAFSRHAMWVGSTFAPVMRVLIFVMLPITYPIAWLLDRLLGEEMATLYSKKEIMEIVSELEESEHSDLDADEERIVHGALQFSHTTVREVMTPSERVISYDINQRINQEFIDEITDSDFSRYPIYSGNKENIVGILYSKDLLAEEDDIAIHQTVDAFDEDFLKVRQNENLDVVLGRMLKQKKHMGIVLSRNNQFMGVVTLEDIIEEIIQFEIEDEGDDDAEDN
jgi:metal transporter CNNM